MLKKNLFRFPLDVMQNSVISTKILANIYKVRFKECDYHTILQYFYEN